MSGIEKNKDSEPRRPPRKSSGFAGRIQRSFSRFLLWLSSLLREPQSRKAALARFLRGAGTIVSNMSPARFTCLLAALAIIIVVALVYWSFPDGSGPNPWTSPTIGVWFSEMEDSATNTDYLPGHVSKATRMIVDALDVFETLACEPNEPDPNRIVVNIMVGCYRTKDPGKNELKLEIVEKGGKVKNPEIGEEYKSSTEFESPLYIKEVIKRIRGRIFEIYPPRGSIYNLQREEDVPLELRESQKREVFLDIGRLAGVRDGDMFDVLPSDKTRVFRNITRIKIMESGPMRSMALVSWDEKIEEGYSVKWVKGGW